MLFWGEGFPPVCLSKSSWNLCFFDPRHLWGPKVPQDPKMTPKWSQDDPIMAPKWHQNDPNTTSKVRKSVPQTNKTILPKNKNNWKTKTEERVLFFSFLVFFSVLPLQMLRGTLLDTKGPSRKPPHDGAPSPINSTAEQDDGTLPWRYLYW